MQFRFQAIATICLFFLSLSACNLAGPQGTGEEPASTELPPSSTAGIFIDTKDEGPVDESPHVTRSRFVKLDLSSLVSEDGQAKALQANQEITLNLFPDVTYTGVIVQLQEDAGTITWIGTLKGIEYSELTMVFTSGVFIGHFASPLGVYEVSSVGDDLYRIIHIDQNQLPGGEG